MRDFRWSNLDMTQANANNVGLGFILTLSVDQTVRAYDISGDKVRCIMSLRHDHDISSLALSPDNSLLAVGGQSSEISIWSVRD